MWHPPGGTRPPTQSIQSFQGATTFSTWGEQGNKRNWLLFIGGETEMDISTCTDMGTGSKSGARKFTPSLEPESSHQQCNVGHPARKGDWVGGISQGFSGCQLDVGERSDVHSMVLNVDAEGSNSLNKHCLGPSSPQKQGLGRPCLRGQYRGQGAEAWGNLR